MAVLRRALLLLVALAAPALAPAGCFEPRQPACAFSCADDGVCPSGFTCGEDGVCYRDGARGTCDIPPQIDAAQGPAGNDGGGAGNDGGGAAD